MSDARLVFNGIDGASGGYLLPPLTAREVSQLARGEPIDPQHLNELRWWYQRTTQATLGPVEDVDPKNLAETGWGVVFASGADPAIKEALGELLAHRRAQAGAQQERFYREYAGADGYRPGETKPQFLARHGAGPGPADPERVPYYLLLVGDPEAIPYAFQYQLDVQYAVGRIHFDTPDEYARYARSVVVAETGKVALPRRAAFVGVRNDDDPATNLSATELVAPLAQGFATRFPGWAAQTVLAAEATKARLTRLLGGAETPALLFTASHGVGFPDGDPRQLPHQGALLCQDWPGPAAWGSRAIPRDFYLAADDVADDARLLGLVAFHFACFGAGTPRLDDFPERDFRTAAAMSDHPFTAALPRRLLGHPKGGALAVVGHVDRAWAYSFRWQTNTAVQTATFRSVLRYLLSGQTIGRAVEDLNTRYGELAATLSNEIDESRYGPRDAYLLADLWTASKDARNCAIVGDPAVRLPVAKSGASAEERPVTEPVRHREGVIPQILVPEPVPPPQPARTGTPAIPGGAPAPAPTGTVAGAAAPAPPAGVKGQAYLLGLPGADAIRDSLNRTLGQLAERLAAFTDEVTSLRVSTYVSDAIEEVRYDAGAGGFTGGARQRALTSIRLDGDTEVCVPTDTGQVDQALWAVHTAMVQQAQANRATMLKAVADVLATLLNLARPS